MISLRNIPELATAVIFDAKEKLHELNPMQILDERPQQMERLFLTIFSQTANKPIEPRLQKIDHVQAIIATLKSDHFLHVYNTLLYRIGKENREKVRSAVLLYVGNKLTMQQFESRMMPCLSARPRGPDPVQLLIDHVKSEHGAALRSAMMAVQKGTDVEIAASESTVSAYEIRYTLSFLGKQSV